LENLNGYNTLGIIKRSGLNFILSEDIKK